MDPWVERDGVFELDLRNLLGGLLGSFIPDPEALGLDFALVAMFVGLFISSRATPQEENPANALSTRGSCGDIDFIYAFFYC